MGLDAMRRLGLKNTVVMLSLKMEGQGLINSPTHTNPSFPTAPPGTSIGGTAFTWKLQLEDLNPSDLSAKVLRVACQTCGMYLSSIEEWKIHRISEHGDHVKYGVKEQNALWDGTFGNPAGQYLCSTCLTPFSSPQNRNKHFKMLIAYPMLTCRLCKTFHRSMELHIQTCHPNVSSCVQCDATNIGDLVSHCDELHGGYDVTWHEVSLKCFGDGKGFSIQETVLNIPMMLPGRGFGSDGPIKPTGYPASLLDTLPIRYENTVWVKGEHYLGLPLLSPNTRQPTPTVHLGTASPVYKCRICGFTGRTYRKGDEMIAHAIAEHFGALLNNKLPTTPPYVCPQNGCKHTTRRKWSIKFHFLSKHIGKRMLYE